MPVKTDSKPLVFLAIVLFLFIIYSCKTSESQTDVLVATVGTETITAVDLDQTVQAIPLPHRLEYKSEQALNDLVQSMIDWKLMAREAVKLGLDRNTDVKAQLETMKDKPATQADQLLANIYIKKKQKELGEIPETEIRKYYDTHQEEYTIPERVKIERVIYKDEDTAKKVLKAMKKTMSFEEFMEQNPSLKRKINVLWLRNSGKDSKMETIALNLSVGEASDIFEVQTGYCLLRVVEKAPSTVRSFTEVQAGIKAKLEVQEQKELLDQVKQNLRKKASITVHQPVLKAYLLKSQSPKTSPH